MINTLESYSLSPVSCDEVSGGTDSGACNYDSSVTNDDGSCTYIDGICETCENGVIIDNDSDDDEVCDEFEISGCTNPTAINYNPYATDDDDSCVSNIFKSGLNKYLSTFSSSSIDKGKAFQENSNIEFKSKQKTLEIMACCHSLNYLDDKLIGDPLDIEMLKFTGFKQLVEVDKAIYGNETLSVIKASQEYIDKHCKNSSSPQNSEEICLMRRFDFDASLQRMSVITKFFGNDNLSL